MHFILPKKCDVTFTREKDCFLAKIGLFLYPCGGDKRDRTADLLNAIQALSQLSYTPRDVRLVGFSINHVASIAKRWRRPQKFCDFDIGNFAFSNRKIISSHGQIYAELP